MGKAFLPLRVALLLTLLLAFASGCRDKSASKQPHLSVQLLADQDTLSPGSSFTLGVLFKPEPGWHIYWVNPGDSGLAPKFAWESSGGIVVDTPMWPYPDRIPLGPLVNYGYGEVLIPFPAKFSAPPPRATSTSVVASLQWLVCKDECLPGEAQLNLTFPISNKAAPPSKHASLFARTLKDIPTKLERVSIAVEEQDDQLILALIPLEPRFLPSALTFFPEDPKMISNSAPQEVSLEGGALRLSLKRNANRREPIKRVRGVLVSPQGWSETGEPKAIEIDTNPEEGAPPAPSGETPSHPVTPPFAGDEIGLLTAILFALIGGLILNVMPCVFPVLSIKILGFIEQSGDEPQRVRAHGLAFAAGVVVSFWVFAATLLILRAGGEQLGWGFQLQSPAFVAVMIFIFMGLGLLLLSDLSLGASVQRLAGRARLSGDYVGSFLNGALATAVATPCTGPFMGSALAATLTLSALSNMIIFTALGVGMSAPYLAIAFRPALLKRLPRPGSWMESFKQVMAFPLFASVVWLTRVFARQMGLESQGLTLLTHLLLGILGVTLSFWLYVQAQSFAKPGIKKILRISAALVMVLGLAIGVPSSSQIEASRSRACLSNESAPMEPDSNGLIWEPYSEQKLSALLAQGRSVYLDFTAEWCITCQVNERILFSSTEVRSLIVQKNVALMRGDWTTKSPSITAALRRYGRNGVPLNVVINKGREETAVVLPNILSPGVVISELRRLE